MKSPESCKVVQIFGFNDLRISSFFCGGRGVGGLSKRRSSNYRKIPKRRPGAYIFQRPFLRGLFLEGLIFRFGEAYLRREICVSKSIGLAL